MADDNWGAVDPAVPIVLLPLRLEVRSQQAGDRTDLRVRIFPDDIAAAEHARLEDGERLAGDAYWRAVWPLDRPTDAPDPWTALVAAVGVWRATWVAAARTPDNLADRAAGGEPVPPPDGTDDLPSGTWARLLPDAFRVVVVQGDVVSTKVGEPIDPAGKLLAPASGDLDALRRTTATLGGGPPSSPDRPVRRLPAARWLADYPTAVREGMAVTVPLTGGRTRIDRLFVLGVRSIDDPLVSADALGQLLAAHAVRDGVALLPPGTPTNTTPEARSAWATTGSRPGPPPADVADVSAPPASGVVADALGIDPRMLAGAAGGHDQGTACAKAFASALWPVTWEPFLERSFGAVVPPWRREALRAHAVAHVRGRGPVPALRVGRQPYGILPVTSTRDFSGETSLERALHQVLTALRPSWAEATAAVPNVMGGPLDRTLPAILGQGPVSRAVRIRRVLTETAATQTANRVLGLEAQEFEHRMSLRAIEQVLGIPFGSIAADEVGEHTSALGLPLADDTDPDVLYRLIGEPDAPEDHASVLQVLLALAERRLRTEARALLDEHWPRAVATLEGSLDLVGDEAYEVGRRALELAGEGRWDEDPDAIVLAAELLDRPAEPWAAHRFADRYPIAALRPHPAAVASTRLDGIQAAAMMVHAAARYTRLRRDIELIASIPTTAERAWLLGETLDCASHRLDAWLTSLATRRLADLRAASADRRTTIIGAYGWLEDIDLAEPERVEPRPPGLKGRLLRAPARDGVVHAPSPQHAATAAVLRGAWLAHDSGARGSPALAIDLSSARVRVALDILDGVRGGQPLGALLGYRLERWLHDDHVTRFIYPLRTAAPLVAAKATDRVTGNGPAPTALESVAATNVVDGVRLLAMSDDLSDDELEALLSKPPPGFERYSDGRRWQPPDIEELGRVRAAISRLALIHDAVADVLLSEGVHQLVAGDPIRSSAAMDALAGDALPPEPAVLQTPRSGIGLTHRVMVLLAGPPRPGLGWGRQPRAAADPQLEAWLRDALGPADAIVLDADADGTPLHTLADTGISAIDFVASTGGVSAAPSSHPHVPPRDGTAAMLGLWRRLRLHLPELPAAPPDPPPDALAPGLLRIDEAWALASSMRTMVAGARALTASDLARPGDITADVDGTGRGVPLRPVDVAELRRRAEAAVSRLERLDLTIPAGPSGRQALMWRLARFSITSPADPFAMADDELQAHVTELVAVADGRRRAARAALLAADELAARPDATDTAVVDALVQVIGHVFADGLPTLPVLRPIAGDSFLAAWRRRGTPAAPEPNQTPDGPAIRPWLSRLGRVRPAVGRYVETLVLRAAAGRHRTLRVVQQPAGAYPSWIGSAFTAEKLPIDSLIGCVVEAATGVTPARRVSGLVVDSWVETVPRRRAHERAGGALTDLHTTGVAVHANGPDARAPQAVLVAVTPDHEPWTWQKLTAVLDDTMDLARLRLVPYDQVRLAGRVLPATYQQDWSLQGAPVIDSRVLSSFRDLRGLLRHVVEGD